MGFEKFTDSSDRQVNQKLLRKILKQVCDKKATFASEVAHYVGADRDKVASIMRQLEESGTLEVLEPKMTNGDKRLLSASRRTGKDSIEQMKQPRWYGLNSDLDWEIHHSSKDLVVDEYHNKIENPEGVDNNIMDLAVSNMEDEGMM